MGKIRALTTKAIDGPPQITIAVAFMQYQDRLKAIRERAQHLKVPLRQVVQAGRVNYSTFHRWQSPNANPQLRVVTNALRRMEEHLDACARDMAERLMRDMSQHEERAA